MRNNKAYSSYAIALRELSIENNIDINQIITELQLVNSYYDDEFIDFLKNPKISKDSKKDVFKKVFTNLNKYVFSTLMVLIDKDLIANINDIVYEINLILEKENNIVNVEVETVRKLTEEELIKIQTYFMMKLNKKIKVYQIINEKLVGGILIKFEGKTIDGSLITKQESLKEYLKK